MIVRVVKGDRAFIPANGARAARFIALDIDEDLVLQSSDEFLVSAEIIGKVKGATARVDLDNGDTITIQILLEE